MPFPLICYMGSKYIDLKKLYKKYMFHREKRKDFSSKKRFKYTNILININAGNKSLMYFPDRGFTWLL